jgi:hypothetical protein
LPQRPEIDEDVYILGAGIAGCTTAWLLSEAGYRVTLIEQLESPISGTSEGALGIHLGGRYFRDWETAIECLHSGILLKKLMPFAVSEKNLRFLVAEDSPTEFEEYLHFYKKLQNYYSKLQKADQVFGKPEEFFRRMTASELKPFTAISGGIESKEPCFDMPRLKSVILSTLKARNTKILCSTQVEEIIHDDKNKKNYLITLKNLKTGIRKIVSTNNVVNCLGYNVQNFGQKIQEPLNYRLDLRVFLNFKLGDHAETKYNFPFVVIPGYMHFVPLGDHTASLVGFHETMEILYSNGSKPSGIPSKWQDQLLSRTVKSPEKLASTIIETAKTRFMPHLGSPKLLRAYPGVAISFNMEHYVKKQAKIIQTDKNPGYYSLNPTKASHSISLALDVADRVVGRSINRGTIKLLSPYVTRVIEGKEIAYLEKYE